MVAATQTKFVIVTPGRTAFTTAAAKEQFTSKPKAVIWTPYLQELYAVHGDIQVVESPAKLMRDREDALKAASAKPVEKPAVIADEAPRAAREPAAR